MTEQERRQLIEMIMQLSDEEIAEVIRLFRETLAQQ